MVFPWFSQFSHGFPMFSYGFPYKKQPQFRQPQQWMQGVVVRGSQLRPAIQPAVAIELARGAARLNGAFSDGSGGGDESMRRCEIKFEAI